MHLFGFLNIISGELTLHLCSPSEDGVLLVGLGTIVLQHHRPLCARVGVCLGLETSGRMSSLGIRSFMRLCFQ